MQRRLIINCSEEQYLNLESAACVDRGRVAATQGMTDEEISSEIARRESLTSEMILRISVDYAANHAIKMAEQAISDSAQQQKEQYASLVAAQKEAALTDSSVVIEVVE